MSELYYITTSRLHSIGRRYGTSFQSSNIHQILHGINEAINNIYIQYYIKTPIEVCDDDLHFIRDAITNSLNRYKQKLNVRSVPRDLNLFQLIEVLGKVDVERISKEVLLNVITPNKRKEKEKLLEKSVLDRHDQIAKLNALRGL